MNATVILNHCCARFVDFALPMLIQSSLLIVVLFALDLCLRERVRAVVRYALWMLLLIKLVLPPSLSLPTSLGYWIPGRAAIKPAAPKNTVDRSRSASREASAFVSPADLPTAAAPDRSDVNAPGSTKVSSYPSPSTAPSLEWSGLVVNPLKSRQAFRPKPAPCFRAGRHSGNP